MMKVKSPLITVVMPVYNAGRFLSEAIESILKQSFSDFEFMIINDGSTDLSLRTIKKYMGVDKRIVLVNRENRGLVSSLNEGIALAKGKYIARMDADDISLPERLLEQAMFMESNPQVGACGSWAEVFGEGREPELLKHPSTTKELKPKLLFSVCFVHPTVILRKEVLDNFHLKYNPNALHVEDYDLWARLVDKTEIANIQRVLLKYRYTNTSVSRIADSTAPELRFQHFQNVFSRQLTKINISNNKQEDKLHFMMLSNKRIHTNEVDLNELTTYFNKLLIGNSNSRYFEPVNFINLLSKKFMIATFFQISKNKLDIFKALRSKFFYLGGYNHLKYLLDRFKK